MSTTDKDLSPSGPIARQCTAHKKSGARCRASAVHGATVCIKHGGAAPQVRAKAALRILEASDQAAAQMIRFMNDKKVPYAVRVRAAQDLLNRASLVGAAMPTAETDRFDAVLADVMDAALVDADRPRELTGAPEQPFDDDDEQWIASHPDDEDRLSYDIPGTIEVRPGEPPVPVITSLPESRPRPPSYLRRVTRDADRDGRADFS